MPRPSFWWGETKSFPNIWKLLNGVKHMETRFVHKFLVRSLWWITVNKRHWAFLPCEKKHMQTQMSKGKKIQVKKHTFKHTFKKRIVWWKYFSWKLEYSVLVGSSTAEQMCPANIKCDLLLQCCFLVLFTLCENFTRSSYAPRPSGSLTWQNAWWKTDSAQGYVIRCSGVILVIQCFLCRNPWKKLHVDSWRKVTAQFSFSGIQSGLYPTDVDALPQEQDASIRRSVRQANRIGSLWQWDN